MPSQWETSLQSKAVSHWLGTKLRSALSLQNDALTVFLDEEFQPSLTRFDDGGRGSLGHAWVQPVARVDQGVRALVGGSDRTTPVGEEGSTITVTSHECHVIPNHRQLDYLPSIFHANDKNIKALHDWPFPTVNDKENTKAPYDWLAILTSGFPSQMVIMQKACPYHGTECILLNIHIVCFLCGGHIILLKNLFTYILRGCFVGIGAIVWLPQCQ